ncbi:hypothetical protein ACEPAH_7728 [Sanghuangporus vaninii]
MHFRVAYPLILLFSLLSLLSLVVAAPDAADKPKPKPSATPTQPPKPPPTSTCSKELLCCLDSTSSTSFSAKLIIDLLHIDLTSEQKGEPVGLTCSTFPKFGGFCSLKPLCCDKSFRESFIAITGSVTMVNRSLIPLYSPEQSPESSQLGAAQSAPENEKARLKPMEYLLKSIVHLLFETSFRSSKF